MKRLHEVLEDTDFKEIEVAKGILAKETGKERLTWREYLIESAKVVKAIAEPNGKTSTGKRN